MIECTDLFPESEWASAHIHGSDVLRINVQYGNKINLVHMRISKIQAFVDAIERERKAVDRGIGNRV